MITARRRFLVIGVVGAAFYAAAQLSAAEPVSAENAWLPWAPPMGEGHAACLPIVNRRNEDQSIVGAASPDYERADLHSSSVKNGVSEMRDVDQVAIPANQRVAFEPGGLHVMLIGPKRPHAVDGRVHIILRLQSGELVEVSAVVRRRDTGSHAGHDHHAAPK